jgi:hypothetical protein
MNSVNRATDDPVENSDQSEQKTAAETTQGNVLLSGDVVDTLRYTRAELLQAQKEMEQAEQRSKAEAPITTRSIDSFRTEYVFRWGTLLEGVKELAFQVAGHNRPVMVTVLAPMTIGRASKHSDQTPDIDLGPYGAFEHGISREHARLYVEDGMFKIMDLNSTNGTYLNGARLLPYQPRVLRTEDELRLGKLVLSILAT